MIPAILLTVTFTIGGALLSYFYDEDAPLLFRLCTGAVAGMALFAVVGFWITLVVGFGWVAIGLAGLLTITPLAGLAHPATRRRIDRDARSALSNLLGAVSRPRLGQMGTIAIVFSLLIVLWLFFARAMIVKSDSIFTGVTNNLGDLPFHLSVITSFTEGNNFPPQDPSYAGARFAYPLLADFVAAVYVRLGASWAGAMFLQNLVLAIGLVAILYRYTWQFTRDRVAAVIAPLLLLFSGGLGFTMLFRRDAEMGVGLGELLSRLPHDYSIMPESAYRWGNALTALLVTQRSLLFGLPVTLLIFMQWWRMVGPKRQPENEVPPATGKAKGPKQKKRDLARPTADLAANPTEFPGSFSFWTLVPAGIAAGLLPLIHAHSFAAVIAAAGVLAILFRQYWRAWLIFIAVALLLAVPQLLWITHGGSVETQSFLGFHFGWDNGRPDAQGLGGMIRGVVTDPAGWVSFAAFWLKNTGLFIPLLFAAAWWMWQSKGPNRRALLFYFPFIFFFLGPNFVKLAPWVWDNIKVLIYWFVASIPLVAGLLGYLWSRNRVARVGVLAAVLVLVLAGGLDVWRVISGATELGVMDAESVTLAAEIRAKLPPQALILNAPTYNTPVFLTGRRSYLGYTGHVWSHGIDFQPRYRILQGIYAGEPGARELIAQNGIEFVVVGGLERSMLNVNDEFFRQFPVAAAAGTAKVFKVSQP